MNYSFHSRRLLLTEHIINLRVIKKKEKNKKKIKEEEEEEEEKKFVKMRHVLITSVLRD